MDAGPQNFAERIDALKGDLVAQGRRVQAMVESSFNAVFARSANAGHAAEQMDVEIDRVDVALEKAAVSLLTDACKAGAALDAAQVRLILTIVKINNELERIADIGVSIAGEAALFQLCSAGQGCEPPATFRVLANSTVGILRDSILALQRMDSKLAKVVLKSESAIGAFKRSLVQDIQQQVRAQQMPLDLASALHDTAMFSIHMADHCTNIAEQVMYVSTGTIMRHMQGTWEEVKLEG